jgi:tricorn protease-like protein
MSMYHCKHAIEPIQKCKQGEIMIRNVLVTAVWIIVASGFDSGLVAQSSGPASRFDPNHTLSFDSAASIKSKRLVSPDGNMRVAVDYKKIRVLSSSSDTVLHEFVTPNRAMAPTFSPDQKSLVFADCTGNLACESQFYVHQLESGNQVILGSSLGVTTQIVFSGNGQRIAAVTIYGPILALVQQQQHKKSLGGEIVVFDLTSKSELLRMAYDKPDTESAVHESPSQIVDQIALDIDGTTLLVTASSGVVKVIDVDTGAEKISITSRAVDLPSEN